MNMTRKEAMRIVIRGAQKYLTHLKYKQDLGPEGIEIHLASFIKNLEQAIVVIQH